MQRRKINMKKISIAIDGPAGAGKSTVAKLLASRLGYVYLDTGAMYRAITYMALTKHLTAEEDIVHMSENLNMEVKPGKEAMHVIVDGKDITAFLRTPEVSAKVSEISAIGKVRETMVTLQRRVSAQGGVVLDGRDIGTVVLPKAEVKVFLTASPRIRAKRRFDEFKAKYPGITLDEVEKEIRLRDKKDSERKVSPLRQAEDAVLVDNSDMTIEETAAAIAQLVEKSAE
jgi:cytidylate kinase